MQNEGTVSQQQTTNPQLIPSSDLQPQQSALQGSTGQVLGTTSFLEQSNTAALTVGGQAIDQEISEIQTQSESPDARVSSYTAGREGYMIAFGGLIIGVLAYALLKQIRREQ